MTRFLYAPRSVILVISAQSAVIALAIAVYFVGLRGWGALILAAVGAVLLYAYDAAPRA